MGSALLTMHAWQTFHRTMVVQEFNFIAHDCGEWRLGGGGGGGKWVH